MIYKGAVNTNKKVIIIIAIVLILLLIILFLIFVGWTNEDCKVITKVTKVTEDLALKAEWISNHAKIITVEFNTDGGNEIDNILLPIDPIRDGYIFVGWLGENGNVITEDSIVDKNITIKATWKETYT